MAISAAYREINLLLESNESIFPRLIALNFPGHFSINFPISSSKKDLSLNRPLSVAKRPLFNESFDHW